MGRVAGIHVVPDPRAAGGSGGKRIGGGGSGAAGRIGIGSSAAGRHVAGGESGAADAVLRVGDAVGGCE